MKEEIKARDEIVLDKYEVLSMERLLDLEAIHQHLWVILNQYKDFIVEQKNSLMISLNKNYGDLSSHYYDPYNLKLKRCKVFPDGKAKRERLDASARALTNDTIENLIEKLHGKLHVKND